MSVLSLNQRQIWLSLLKFMLFIFLSLHCLCGFASGTPNKKFVKWLEKAMDENKVPGVSIAVIRSYKIDWVAGFGVRNILSEDAIDNSTLFQAGSISKPVTALAILKSAEDGKFNLDVNINDILKSWQVPSSPYFQNEFITARELLSHSSGTNVPGFIGYPRNANLPSLQNVLNGTPPANSPAIRITGVPGEALQYSGGGYAILQQALMDVYHKPFNEIMNQLIFSPLGMTDSTFEEPLPELLMKKIATPYYPKYKSVPGGPHTYVAAAAAGLWTTPFDLAKLTISIMRAIKGDPYQVISTETANQMTEAQIQDMGLGFIVQVNKYGESSRSGQFFMHHGQTEGYRSLLIARVKGGFGVIIMTNMSQEGKEIMNGKVKDSWDFIFDIEKHIADSEGWY